MTGDFTEQRVKMVDGQLRTTDVNDHNLLDAMLAVPREEFVPARRRPFAYIDEDVEVAAAEGGKPPRYIMEPAPFGRLLQLAAVTPRDFVLDIGCATGYSAAVLSRLAGSVVALESDDSLADFAGSTLNRLGFDNIAVVTGPLAQGYALQAPYDVIVVEGAVEQVPEALFDQLRDGGRMVAVVGAGHMGQGMIFRKDDGFVSSRRVFDAAVKRLAEFRVQPAFEF